MKILAALLVACSCFATRAGAQLDTILVPSIVQQLQTLEARWNDAHIRGDTVELLRQWADDITFVVPGMPRFTKTDVMSLWRSGRAKLLRHETYDVTIRPYANAAVVEGRLRRQRNFNGRVVEDDWRFTKTFVRRDGEWRVVSYHASEVPPPR